MRISALASFVLRLASIAAQRFLPLVEALPRSLFVRFRPLLISIQLGTGRLSTQKPARRWPNDTNGVSSLFAVGSLDVKAG